MTAKKVIRPIFVVGVWVALSAVLDFPFIMMLVGALVLLVAALETQ